MYSILLFFAHFRLEVEVCYHIELLAGFRLYFQTLACVMFYFFIVNAIGSINKKGIDNSKLFFV